MRFFTNQETRRQCACFRICETRNEQNKNERDKPRDKYYYLVEFVSFHTFLNDVYVSFLKGSQSEWLIYKEKIFFGICNHMPGDHAFHDSKLTAKELMNW